MRNFWHRMEASCLVPLCVGWKKLKLKFCLKVVPMSGVTEAGAETCDARKRRYKDEVIKVANCTYARECIITNGTSYIEQGRKDAHRRSDGQDHATAMVPIKLHL